MNMPVGVGKPSHAFKAVWRNREDGVVIQLHYFPNIILELEDLQPYAADEQTTATAQGILHVRNSPEPQFEGAGRNPKSIKSGFIT